MSLPTSLADLPAWMAELQSRHPGGRTNYFRQALTPGDLSAWESERCRLFLLGEPEGFARLYFFAATADDLRELLARVEDPRPLVVSVLYKQPLPDVRGALETSGFAWHDEYRRMICRPLPAVEPDPSVAFATPEEARDLRVAMPSEYDPYASHFPTADELADWAGRSWILVRRHEGRVTGYIAFRELGRHANFNYVKNDPAHPRDALLLMNQLYGELRSRGIGSAELWLRHDNHKLIKLYQFFGWKFDGLTAQYLVRKPTPTAS